MNIKLFIKDDCPRCPAAKRACEGIDALEVWDVASIDGLAEAAFYGILATPTVLVVDTAGAEIASWRGEAPERSALTAYLVQ